MACLTDGPVQVRAPHDAGFNYRFNSSFRASSGRKMRNPKLHPLPTQVNLRDYNNNNNNSNVNTYKTAARHSVALQSLPPTAVECSTPSPTFKSSFSTCGPILFSPVKNRNAAVSNQTQDSTFRSGSRRVGNHSDKVGDDNIFADENSSPLSTRANKDICVFKRPIRIVDLFASQATNSRQIYTTPSPSPATRTSSSSNYSPMSASSSTFLTSSTPVSSISSSWLPGMSDNRKFLSQQSTPATSPLQFTPISKSCRAQSATKEHSWNERERNTYITPTRTSVSTFNRYAVASKERFYAAPTFVASPAASTLPVPRFFQQPS